MSGKGVVISIRLMKIDDLASVFHLGETLFTPYDFPNLYRTWDQFEVAGIFVSEPELCLVAEANKQLVGFTLGTVIKKTNTAWNYGHLVWLGVNKKYQRSGVAQKLLNQFRQIMTDKGVRILIVDTQSDNKPAVKFFKRYGFTNPKKHLYMTLNLDEFASGKELQD